MVEPIDELGRELGLRPALIRLTEQWLPVKIGELDHVGIDDCKAANSCPCEGRDDSASDAPRTDNRDTCRAELALADASDLRKDDVPRVALEFFVGEAHRPPIIDQCCRSPLPRGWSR